MLDELFAANVMNTIHCKWGGCVSSSRPFNEPLEEEVMEGMSQKNFAPDTNKKVKWEVKMYRDWHNYRNGNASLQNIYCDLDNKSTITQESSNFALSCFITEVKKLDGSDFHGKTLYEILLCIQFHLEKNGYTWKLLNDGMFCEVKFTLDNMMKLRTSQGVGLKVKKAKFMSHSEEDYLWNMGYLGVDNADKLLNTMVFILGKGFGLCAGKEHQCLRSPPFQSQFEFLHDSDGEIFIRFTEDIGLKTDKGGIKQCKVEPKEVQIIAL